MKKFKQNSTKAEILKTSNKKHYIKFAINSIFFMTTLYAMQSMAFTEKFIGANDTTNITQLTEAPSSTDTILPPGKYLFKIKINAQDRGPNSEIKSISLVSNKSVQPIIDKLIKTQEDNEEFKKIDWSRANASAKMQLRGLIVTADLKSDPHSDLRTLTINYAGQTKVFTDHFGAKSLSSKLANKSAAIDLDVYKQLENWFKDNLDNKSLLKSLSKAFVGQTAIDPVAGNPSSFLAQMTNSNFQVDNNISMFGNTSGMDVWSISPQYYNDQAETEVVDSNNNQFEEKDTQAGIIVPIRYSHYFGRRNRLTIDLPLGYHTTDDAQTYSGSFGLSDALIILQHPHWAWALTPQARFGVVGSMDMGSGTLAYSGGAGSRIAYQNKKYSIGLTNTVDYISTMKVKIGDIETPYDLYNVIIENGINTRFSFSKSYNLGAFYQRLDVVAGEKWYIPSSNTIGLDIAKSSHYNSATFDRWSLAAGYLFAAKNYDGFNVTLSFAV